MSTADNVPDQASGARVQSVERALALLDAIAAASPRGDTAAELALACGINRATAWRLLGELGQIRKQGYAVSAGELEPTLCGVSAPVLRPGEDRPLAVFSIWGPADRVPPSRFHALGAVAIDAAASVEVALRD